MQKDKHNIYSKEELLKLIKEGKNAPADMDEFECEALEGLKLLDKPDVLNELNTEIDSIVAKDKRKKTIYYFSSAASLVLIIGLVLFFKNEVAPDITKNETPIASAENLKKPDESTVSNTTPITQPETQTTYEAKEPEALAKRAPDAKKEEYNSLLSQTIATSAPVEEKEQAAKQVAKDAYNEADTKLVLAEKANHYEESKAVVPQVSQEQQQDVVTTETTSNNNSVLSDREKDYDKSKEESIVATGNTAPTQQPTQAAFSNAQGAKVAENSSYQTKNDESVAVQKNKTAGLYQANSPDKKSTAKSYREPAFIDGDAAFAAYAKQNLKISSPTNSGIVIVEFLITKTGKAEKIKILKPLDGCNACSQDVIDLIKSVKKWTPAAIGGDNSDAFKKISIQYN
ncbi:MAG TPA: hypothetical protein VK835_06380 [Bacteroidia bacterium]|nr:hypothetical protein [Bacteroidia bacterium]